MEWLRERWAGIFVHYINIIFMLSVLHICYRVRNFNYLYITLLYIGMMVIYWFYTGLLHRGKQRIIFLMLAATLIAVFTFFFREKIIAFFYENIVNNVDAINNLLYDGKATFFYQYKPIITVVLPIVVFILFFFYDNKITEGVLLLSLVVMIFFWYLEYFNEIKLLILPFVVISTVTYLINNYKKTLFELQKKGIYSSLNGRRIVANIIVFTLLAAVIGVPLPQDIKGKDDISLLQQLEKKYSEAQGEGGTAAAVTGIYGLEYSGYTNTEKKLGGPIKLDKGLALRVESDKAYYLKGDVKEEYTGDSWRKTEEELKKLGERGNPSIEKVRNNYSGTLFFQDSDLKQMKIYPEKLKSTSFMVPIYTNTIKGFEGEILINEENSIFASMSKVSKMYTVEYFDVDYKSEFKNYYTVYYGHNDKYKKYLQLPKGVTERTVDLVYSIVRDTKNNEEKVEKIREYLSKNYTYTLNAAVLPTGKDFVDYFLFEDPKGYCVHFASALAVMYRIAGIPARYVEGFKMNENSKKGNIYEVTNDTAHAWVEYLVSDDVWSISDCAPTALENNIRIEEENKQKEQNTNVPLPTGNGKRPNSAEEDLDEPGAGSGSVNAYKNVNTIIGGKFIYVEISALLVIIIAVVAAIRQRRKQKMLKDDSLIPLYNYIIKRLKRYKIVKASDETEKEFAARKEQELKSILLPLTNKVYAEYYGGIKDSKIEKRTIYYNFEQYLKKKENKFIYYLKKLF